MPVSINDSNCELPGESKAEKLYLDRVENAESDSELLVEVWTHLEAAMDDIHDAVASHLTIEDGNRETIKEPETDDIKAVSELILCDYIVRTMPSLAGNIARAVNKAPHPGNALEPKLRAIGDSLMKLAKALEGLGK